MARRKGKVANSVTPAETPTTATNVTTTDSDHEVENRSNLANNGKTPIPSGAGRSRSRRRTHGKYVYEDSESDGAENRDMYRKLSMGKSGKVHPSTGISCKRRKRCISPTYTRVRTLYSHFPSDYCRLILLHLFSTLLLYLMVYPIVNFFWTYLINVDDEVATLFHYITEEPSYEGGYFNHFRKMKWLSWPQVTAESLALLLATTIKDTAILHWEGVMDDMSLTNIVGNHISKRYGR